MEKPLQAHHAVEGVSCVGEHMGNLFSTTELFTLLIMFYFIIVYTACNYKQENHNKNHQQQILIRISLNDRSN